MELKNLYVLLIAALVSGFIAFLLMRVARPRVLHTCKYDTLFALYFSLTMGFIYTLSMYVGISDTAIGFIATVIGMWVSTSLHWVCTMYDTDVLFMPITSISKSRWQVKTIRRSLTHVVFAVAAGCLMIIGSHCMIKVKIDLTKI